MKLTSFFQIVVLSSLLCGCVHDAATEPVVVRSEFLPKKLNLPGRWTLSIQTVEPIQNVRFNYFLCFLHEFRINFEKGFEETVRLTFDTMASETHFVYKEAGKTSPPSKNVRHVSLKLHRPYIKMEGFLGLWSSRTRAVIELSVDVSIHSSESVVLMKKITERGISDVADSILCDQADSALLATANDVQQKIVQSIILELNNWKYYNKN